MAPLPVLARALSAWRGELDALRLQVEAEGAEARELTRFDAVSIALHRLEKEIAEVIRCSCKLCTKPAAYPGALFCGAACSQRWESGERPAELAR